ncbi:MAG: transglutaminase-like domain-containing protein, partial [Coprobacillus sp.]
LLDDSYYKKNDEPIRDNYTKNIVFTIWTNPNIVVPNDTEYYNYVLKEYMNVPDSLKPKFKQLVDKINLWYNTDISQGFIEEKVTFVREILNEYTNYDLNSGPLPAGKDFVEYFLFENQKGSCTHYASTATLLLRYLGVPSRYVTGFVMTTSDFDKNKEAVIKNNRAHAWVEIYMQGIGWVPYDFTKSAYMGSETTESSMASQLDELLRIQNDSNLAPVIPERKPPNPLELDPRRNDIPEEETDIEVDKVPWYDSIIQYSQYLYIVGGVILVFVVYRYGQKTYMTLKIKKAENNKKIILIYQRMLLIDKEKNYISQSVLDIAYKAKFSQHLIDIDEVNIVEKELKSLQKTIYQTLPWYKKILYKYILGYM